MFRRLARQESVRPRGSSAVAVVLRLTLKAANTLLALLGVAVMIYAVYMYGEVHRRPPPTPLPPPPAPHYSPPPAVPPTPPPAELLAGMAAGVAAVAAQHAAMPWFIYAFFGAGLFTFITASTGLIGAARNSRFCLGLYAFLAILLLLAQGALALAFFADAHWQKRFPPDETGEARKLRRWIQHRMDVCKWVGLALLLLQVLSVAVAFALSAAQARALEGDSEEEDEVWGRRQPLLAADAASGSGAAGAGPSGDVEAATALPTPTKDDPWSQRMRDKYGLDTSQFTYAPPDQTAGSTAPATSQATPQDGQQQGSSRCSIM